MIDDRNEAFGEVRIVAENLPLLIGTEAGIFWKNGKAGF
jgi:hypothetical protein